MAQTSGKIVIGLDGGGTKIQAIAADESGTALGSGRAGACNLAAVSTKKCIDATLDAITQALTQADASRQNVVSICAGLAGVSFTSRVIAYRKALQRHFPDAVITIVPDYVTAHAGALNGSPGIIVIAGTGSVAYGENAAGQRHKSGAYGFRIDDSGSGYGVGRQAIASVMRAVDGTGNTTALKERVLAHLNLKSIADIVPAVYGDKVDRVTIASLAEIVAAAALEGDTVAQVILSEAGASLARLTSPILSNLFHDSDGPVPIVLIGSLWNSGEPLKSSFLSSLKSQSIPVVLQDLRQDPGMGAVTLALRKQV